MLPESAFTSVHRQVARLAQAGVEGEDINVQERLFGRAATRFPTIPALAARAAALAALWARSQPPVGTGLCRV